MHIACDLTVCGGRNISAPISGNDRCVAIMGSTRNSAAVSDPGVLALSAAGSAFRGRASQAERADLRAVPDRGLAAVFGTPGLSFATVMSVVEAIWIPAAAIAFARRSARARP